MIIHPEDVIIHSENILICVDNIYPPNPLVYNYDGDKIIYVVRMNYYIVQTN